MTEVVTGDAVVLDVSPAAFPSRMAALLIDMATQFTLLGIALFVFGMTVGGLSEAAGIAILTVILVLVIVGYPTIFETLSRGKTLGKLAMGLRVVSDDGGPERFRQALIRALAAIFEIWSIVLDPVALLTSLLSAKGKRLGDMFAGTYVITERVPKRRNLRPEFAVIPPPLVGWAAQLELSGLPDSDAEAAGSFLRRYYDLQPAARYALSLQLAAAVAARVTPPPPPGTPPAAFLAAVLAVRRERDQARLASRLPAHGADQAASTVSVADAPSTASVADAATGPDGAPTPEGTASPGMGAQFAPPT